MNNPSDKKKNEIAGIIRNFLRGKHSAEGEKLFDAWWKQEPAADAKDVLSGEEGRIMSDRVLQRLKARLPGGQYKPTAGPDGQHEPTAEPAVVRRIGLRRRQLWWSAAAAVLLFVGAGSYYYYKGASDEKNWLMIATKAGEKRKLVLSDGTTVQLNENTQVSYPRTYKDRDNRAIRMEGEAFFEVAKDPAHPFIVKARHAFIQVLGTSFDVLTQEADSSVVVAMQDGKVSLSDDRRQEHKAMILVRGDIGILGSTGLLSYEPGVADNGNYYSWVNNNGLSFDGTALSQVVRQMERIYGCRIEIDEPLLKNRKITLQYPAADLPTMLNVIGKTMRLQILYTDHVYHIK